MKLLITLLACFKVLDFPDIHTVADLVHDFIKSQKELNAISG